MESMTAPKKSTVEPLSPTLRTNLLAMVDQLGSHAKASVVLHIGQGTLSSALKNGAGRNLRGRLERNHSMWARDQHGATESGTGRVLPPATTAPPTPPNGTKVPPILAGFGQAAKNTARLDAFGEKLDRLERKFDALLEGFGLDPADYA